MTASAITIKAAPNTTIAAAVLNIPLAPAFNKCDAATNINIAPATPTSPLAISSHDKLAIDLTAADITNNAADKANNADDTLNSPFILEALTILIRVAKAATNSISIVAIATRAFSICAGLILASNNIAPANTPIAAAIFNNVPALN